MSLKNHTRTRNGKMPKNQEATATIEKLANLQAEKKKIKKIKRKRKKDNLKTHHPRQPHPIK
jgi:hypothetical protein